MQTTNMQTINNEHITQSFLQLNARGATMLALKCFTESTPYLNTLQPFPLWKNVKHAVWLKATAVSLCTTLCFTGNYAPALLNSILLVISKRWLSFEHDNNIFS